MLLRRVMSIDEWYASVRGHYNPNGNLRLYLTPGKRAGPDIQTFAGMLRMGGGYGAQFFRELVNSFIEIHRQSRINRRTN